MIPNKILIPNALAAKVLDPLQPAAALVARCYVSWQFLSSGYLKTLSWDSTLYLFDSEYHTPLLPPHVAAYAGTFGELFFPTLLILGLFGRLSAIGLSFVNAVAVISYTQVLLAPGYEAALGQHVLWGSILFFLCIFGPGKISVDYFLSRSSRTPI